MCEGCSNEVPEQYVMANLMVSALDRVMNEIEEALDMMRGIHQFVEPTVRRQLKGELMPTVMRSIPRMVNAAITYQRDALRTAVEFSEEYKKMAKRAKEEKLTVVTESGDDNYGDL